ncbi:efflux RND transporter periplasmic adaptor subun it [Desulfonema ishimotonii]|uniref:Efflux RND transporter periplasmic adaptor subun it n=1 Tax=Desulfonema ishimotonii TaxID=45657 RepID=A0A401G4I2_9BACT|nr:efflux RND transporter periplasmic adaptor subunit [Desulfonema ishimotonii]GBC64142.1 efflux RND transporter periplasmic adaptor subun it [Desulfonema ishimotonii]
MKKKPLKFLILFASLALISLSASCTRKDESRPAPAIRPIRTIRVGAPDPDRERTFSGVSGAAVEIRLSFRVGGKIEELPVKSGMKLEKGDLIARLDPTDYDLTVRQYRAQLAQARAVHIRVRADYDRDKQLYEAGDISRSQLGQSLAARRSAKAQVDAAGEAIHLAEQKLKYTTLKAPVSGTVASVPAEVHETVAAGQPIATITSGDAMEMEIGVPESLISGIQVGFPARIRFDAIPDRNFHAKTVEVGIEATRSSTWPVTLRILEQDDRLRPGMSGEAALTFEAGGEFITIPPVAVVSTPEGQQYVWVYRERDATVTRRDITVGTLTSHGLQVTEGLEPGDIIAVRGVHRLTGGMRVKRLSPTAATRTEEVSR